MLINPIKANDQKIFNEQQSVRLNPPQTPSKNENGVNSNATEDTYVKRKDSVNLNYDVNRYVQILKNMVIPPQDRFDASILLELELGNNISAQEVKDMINQVEQKDREKEYNQSSPQVTSETSDTDIRGKKA